MINKLFLFNAFCILDPDCYNLTKESQISTDQTLSIKTTLSYYISYGTHTTL